VIYYPKRFLFVHVPKNAGSSMGYALGKALVDRYAKVLVEDRRGKINPLKDPISSNNLLMNVTQKINFANAKYKTTFKKEDFFKFGIARNPFDRAVSIYHFLIAPKGPARYILGKDKLIQNLIQTKTKTFEEFVDFAFGSYNFPLFCMKYSGWTTKVILPQTYYLYDAAGASSVDYIGRYENLNAGWDYITDHLQLSVELPWNNRSVRKRDWESYYTPRSKSIVKEFFKRDFELLGY
jgi:hypothetical protein